MNKNNTHPFANAAYASATAGQPLLLAVFEDPLLLHQVVYLAQSQSLPLLGVPGIGPALAALQTGFFSGVILRVADTQAAFAQLVDAGFQGPISLLLNETEPAPPLAALGVADALRMPLESALRQLLDATAQGPQAAPQAVIDGVIGSSPAIRRLCELILTVAPMPSTVLIEGESGTGKEIAARSLHRLSQRHAQPFVAINCGAISPELIESELFGHVKGAFTGAWQAHDGLFLAAHQGTLFLDEIGELPLPAQAKLLRVLEERRLRRVGAEQEVAVDVRVVAATNRDLLEEVRAGRFRADLYYRLHVVTLTIPPLRERLVDVPALVRHFCQVLSGELNIPVREPAADTLQLLSAYAFPGNVRELRNLVMRWLIFGATALEALAVPAGDKLPPVVPAHVLSGDTAGLTLDEVERRHILQTLADTGGNKTQAAYRLGISRRTLERKCARWGV